MYIPASELNHGNISSQQELGFAAIVAGQTVIEFSQTTSVDSSAVACLLAWKRYAQKRGAKLEFQHLPANLANLTELYGATELLLTN